MKELSIEEKAKRYDEALEKAKTMQEKSNGMILKKWLCGVFPELKESEDERIRKAIYIYLDWLEGRKDYAPKGKYSIRDMLAWLEKQGNPQVRTGLEWANTIDNACDERYAEEYSNGEYCHEQSFKWGFQEGVEWLEKQDEQNSIEEPNFFDDFRNSDIEVDSNEDGLIAETIKYKNEKQGEQKFADKVELKFKVGDWVVFNNKHQSIYQVEKIEDGYYILRHTHGGTFRVCVLHNENLRHWTIQDAKDGDVLYLQHDGKEHIIIYKGVIKERFRTFISAYCAYNSIVDAFCFADVSRYTDIAYGGITPATKEQRDTLFAKMKEAGYEWDAEKKKLKKQEIAEIPFGAKDSELQEATYYIPKGFYSVLDGNKVIIKRFKNPRPQNN